MNFTTLCRILLYDFMSYIKHQKSNIKHHQLPRSATAKTAAAEATKTATTKATPIHRHRRRNRHCEVRQNLRENDSTTTAIPAVRHIVTPIAIISTVVVIIIITRTRQGRLIV
ncbi:MAG: hypothetical protein R2795_25320 [Saprospiraceae bacterium]